MRLPPTAQPNGYPPTGPIQQMRTATYQAGPFPARELGHSMREIASREASLPECGNAELSALDRGAVQQSGIRLRRLRIVGAKHKT